MVNGTAVDRFGIRRVKVVLNGVTTDAVLGVPSGNAVPWSLAVSPRIGMNTLVVTAYDMRGNSTKLIRNFSFELR